MSSVLVNQLRSLSTVWVSGLLEFESALQSWEWTIYSSVVRSLVGTSSVHCACEFANVKFLELCVCSTAHFS
jgi:hypothetical protein